MMKYSVPSHDEEYPKRQESRQIGVPGQEKVEVLADGTIKAKAFVDKDHQDLDYNFDEEKQAPFFQKNINDSLKIKFVPKSFNVYYKATCKKIFSIINSFGKFINRVKEIPLAGMGRYKHAHRLIRRGIKKLLKDNKRYIFTKNDVGRGPTAIPYVESKTFGPYNYPVKLKASSDIDFIRDIILIKTGGFTDSSSPNYDSTQTEVVYVSPHIEKSFSGVFHTSTGINLNGDNSIQTGLGLDDGISSGVSINLLSSEDFSIPSGSYLSGSGAYNHYISSDANSAPSLHVETNAPSNTLFKEYNLSKRNLRFSSDHWDGVIPSGAWFSIESWCYNDKYVGFDGQIDIEPVDQSLGVTMNETVIGKAEDSRGYAEAYSTAEKKAEKVFYKKLNKKLMDNGLKNKKSRYKKYEYMIYKSAQGYFDKEDHQQTKDYDLKKSANPTGESFVYVTQDQKTSSHTNTNRPAGGSSSGSSSSNSGGNSGY